MRNLPEIVSVLEQARGVLSDRAVDYSIQTFRTLAEAEAKTHGASSADDVHFHEVGAIDSIIDIVGSIVLLMDFYQVDEIYCSDLPLSSGKTGWTQHGILPVPAFATYQLLKQMPCCTGPPSAKGELITPTAAALIKTLTTPNTRGTYPKNNTFTPIHIGIGAGTKDFYEHPNIIRTIIGYTPLKSKQQQPQTKTSTSNTFPTYQPHSNSQETNSTNTATTAHNVKATNNGSILTSDTLTTTQPPSKTRAKVDVKKNEGKSLWKVDRLTKLEANIDDATPEHLAHVVKEVLALNDIVVDVWLTPIVMKKGRSAQCLSCLLLEQDDDDEVLNRVLGYLFEHSTTLGVRIQRKIERIALQRKMISVSLPGVGIVSVKLGIYEKKVVSCKPEFDECQALSIQTGIPISTLSNELCHQAVKNIQDEGIYTTFLD